ncbi:M28 family peptidase [Rhodohalobacter mucosus]|nr:M28 family peptidase [Rhodohalobacter mucosus]
MRHSILAAAVIILAGCAAQEKTGSKDAGGQNIYSFSEHITPGFLQTHLQIIAHDSLRGRATGTPGLKKAASYLSGYYEELGIKPMGDNGSYYQTYRINAEFTDSLLYDTFRIEGEELVKINHTKESADSQGEYIRLYGGTRSLTGDVVFAGFGLNDPEYNINHLEGTDLEEKWVLIFEDIPYVQDGDTLISPEITSNSRIQAILGERDAAGILLISDYSQDEFEDLAAVSSSLMSKPSSMSLAYRDGNRSTNRVYKGINQISPRMAATMLELDDQEDLEAFRQSLIEDAHEFRARETGYYLEYTPFEGPGYIETQNVIALLEGADPVLKEEVLVLMAHYDHIGVTQPNDEGDAINNGADDNGSGTVALMAIANAFQEAADRGYRPGRSVLFLHVSGEENGLLGSRYYSDHPVIPIEKTVANFNTDMVGRSDPENIEKGDTDYVYLIGGEIISSGLDSLVQAGNRKSVNMRLDRSYNDLDDPNQFYRRSDHWNFGRLEVPFVFFFTGVHEDYHRPSDHSDKIDYDKLSRVARLIYTSSVEVANYDGRPVVDNQQFIEITRR